MVRAWQHISWYARLVRLPNLIMIMLTMYLVRHGIIAPIIQNYGLSLQLSEFHFALLVLATVLIAAAGNIINDYFDRKTDMVNHPESVVVFSHIHHRLALALHAILSIVGILAGAYMSWASGLIHLSIVFPGISGLLWFYSTTYKRQLIIGNLLVALLCAMVPFTVWLFEVPLLSRKYGAIAGLMGLNIGSLTAWIVAFGVFAFLLTLVREIVKDIEDFEGDNAYGMQTLPIVIGIGYSKLILFTLHLFLLVGMGYILLIHLRHTLTLVYMLLLYFVPLVASGYLLFRASEKKDYTQISSLLKLVMLTGTLYALVARFTMLC